VNRFSKYVGTFAFGWRIILTTGTGSIFGFLVAREAYATAILAPLFIVMSLLYGTAVYFLILKTISKFHKTYISNDILMNLRRLTICFYLLIFIFYFYIILQICI
jgi:molybdopterin-containing oxidoreductase family membrane subunit